MPPTSKLRRLFQTLSVLSAVACVLLCVLWVRSYWWWDSVYSPAIGGHKLSFSSVYGRFRFATFDDAYSNSFTGEQVTGWGAYSKEINGPPSLRMVNTPVTEFALGFAGSRDRYGIVAVIPLWTPALLLIGSAVSPWINSRPQFSLRTLLIATTLVAVVLGMVAWAAG